MVSLMAFCKDIKELLKMQELSKKNAALVSYEKWIMDFYNRIEDVIKKVEENKLVDIICFDLAQDEGISYAKYLRKCYEQAFMILLADSKMSPMDYIKPDIMPSGLIIQPATTEDMDKVIYEVFESYMEKIKTKNMDKLYIVATRQGRVSIPYHKIVYFEARNKKIYIRYNNKEIGFFSTMDKLETEMEYDFVRTHRSFMVNRDYIRRINLSRNVVVLKDDIEVPLSRSYKPSIKELGNDR